MYKDCGHCGNSFEIAEEDKSFYNKVSPTFNGKKYEILLPTLCPECRQRRRLSYRNERVFYKRKCDLTGEDIVSTYPTEFPGKVYSSDAFWGDDWDAKDYGRDFDFSRPFFEQYKELTLDAPRLHLINFGSENSIYTQHSAYNKNCYMCINSGWNEDLFYCSNYNIGNKNCADCLAIRDCELCYYAVDVKKSFNSTYLYECENMTDCHYCYDCKSCQNCFGCWNLRRKQYCLYNEQLSKEEYERKVKELMPKSWAQSQEEFGKMRENMRDKAIHKYLRNEKSINCTGDNLKNCKNVRESYHLFESEDCKYCYDCGEMKDCYDTMEPYRGELQYESHGCNMGVRLISSYKCYEDNDCYYSQYCWYSKNIFGCIGLKNQKYCVLNKQYSQEEYEKLVSRIVEHMIETGEWGEHFPVEDSPFAYDETTANYYYPMTQEDILADGWKWKGIAVGDRPFKIIPAEKKFYERMGLPEPKLHPDERFKMRMDLRNPRKLRKIVCGDCGCEIFTTYPEGKVKNIYCEKCYNKAIYG